MLDARLNRAPCGYLSFTDDNQILAVNETLMRMLGYAPGELTCSRVDLLLAVPSRVLFQIYFQPLIKLNGKVEEMYLSLRSKSGEDVPVLLNAARTDEEGRSVNECVLIPMRRRIEYEHQIGVAEKAANGARHELERLQRELDRIREGLTEQ